MHNKSNLNLHFVGIGGIGMSGIAEVFLNQGYTVSGSDQATTETTKRLSSLGAQIFTGHSASHIRKTTSVVVVSSAVSPENPEVKQARAFRIPVVPRAEMLGELMRGKIGIAVAGTHGKTTTTSMLATVLTECKLDPTLIIGGKVDSLGGNAKLGQGQYVVAEADESDGSFLHLPATLGIVTNIDSDHLDHYKEYSKIETAFAAFVGQLPFYGLAAVCGEDPGVRKCLNQFTKPFVTYGLSDDWDLYAKNVQKIGVATEFEVWRGKSFEKQDQAFLGKVTLAVPGLHNVLNALATTAIGLELELSPRSIFDALGKFRGVKRRFETKWQNAEKTQLIVDDYGHHPTEIQATLKAAREFWKGRVITVFQPHRFSRTLYCLDGFAAAFAMSDIILILDIYPAGEAPIEGVDAHLLISRIKESIRDNQQVLYAGDLTKSLEVSKAVFQNGDLLLCMGAGTITRLPEMLISELK